jgi:hypothetical protein
MPMSRFQNTILGNQLNYYNNVKLERLFFTAYNQKKKFFSKKTLE